MVLPMQTAGPEPPAPADDAVIARVLAGEQAAFEVLMRRYNRRVFRAARAVLWDDAEAEDVAQDAWVRAYVHLRQFAGRASFATWLSRIAFHEALARRRRRVRHLTLDAHAATLPARSRQPEDELGARQLAAVLEDAVDRLPVRYRTAFVLRDVEGLSTSEAATCLEVPAATVKTRLHRARVLLRQRLDTALDVSIDGVYEFGGARCDRIVAAVLARIGRAAFVQPMAGVSRIAAS